MQDWTRVYFVKWIGLQWPWQSWNNWAILMSTVCHTSKHCRLFIFSQKINLQYSCRQVKIPTRPLSWGVPTIMFAHCTWIKHTVKIVFRNSTLYLGKFCIHFFTLCKTFKNKCVDYCACVWMLQTIWAGVKMIKSVGTVNTVLRALLNNPSVEIVAVIGSAEIYICYQASAVVPGYKPFRFREGLH